MLNPISGMHPDLPYIIVLLCVIQTMLLISPRECAAIQWLSLCQLVHFFIEWKKQLFQKFLFLLLEQTVIYIDTNYLHSIIHSFLHAFSHSIHLFIHLLIYLFIKIVTMNRLQWHNQRGRRLKTQALSWNKRIF